MTAMDANAALRVLQTALPLFLVLALGMLCRKTKLFTAEGVAALKSLVVNITLPAVMFSAFATAEYSASSIWIPLTIFIVCIAALALGTAACRLLHIGGRLSPYLFTGFEAGMLGYALFALLYPSAQTSAFAIVDLGQVLFVFTVYKSMLAASGSIGGGLKSVLKDAVRSPVIWGIAAGLIVGASGLYRTLEPSGVSSLISSTTTFIAAPTSVVILLTIGYDFVPREIQWKKTAVLVAVRVVIMAVMLGAALAANKWLLGGAMHTGALALLFILPPPYVLPVFADAHEEQATISSALSALTLVSIVLFAVLTAVGI